MLKQLLRKRSNILLTEVIEEDEAPLLGTSKVRLSRNKMGNFHKLALVLWKNWILRKRHYMATIIEVLLPVLLTCAIVALRQVGGAKYQVTHIDHPTYYPEVPVISPQQYQSNHYTVNGGSNPFQQEFISVRKKLTIMYTPNNTVTYDIMNYLKSLAEAVTPNNVTLLYVENDLAMEETSRSADAKKDASLLGGISFVGNFSNDGSLPKTLHYRIRFRREYSNNADWQTGLLVPPLAPPDPTTPTSKSLYATTLFVPIQHLISMKFIDMATNFVRNKSVPIYSVNVNSQRFPYPPFYLDNGFQELMENLIPFFMVFSYMFIASDLVKGIVLEKQLGIKELMKLMGLPGWIQMLGWFISYFIMVGISTIIIVFLLCTSFKPDSAILERSDFTAVFFMLSLYVATAIVFCFFISSMFSNSTFAMIACFIIWIASYAAPYNLLAPKYDQLTLDDKLAVSLLPNMALAWTLRLIGSFEGRSLGLQWANFAEPSFKGDDLTMAHLILMYFIDIAVYGTLTWYIDHIFPGTYGVRKPWYFVFTKTYWTKPTATWDSTSPTPINNPSFEADPTDLSPSIQIQNLTKCYGWNETGKKAVNNLSINFYEGQITALLGHNGAGKTTTMSVLTGMFTPTSGTAFINGYDIRTDIDTARQNIGLCPQHNMLFDELTVSEHLLFFGRLKKLSGRKLTAEVDSLIKKLQLWEKRNVISKSLSGGMKRKLNLGISLIGGAKIVILDEPTSGMDPEARRAIWDLLQELRPGRCIVLTTHFMEEADCLGDRIAIMAHGQVQCCGTPLFLKKRYGAGYHLNVSKNRNFDLSQFTGTLQRYIPESVINVNVSNEVSFTLPSSETGKFAELFHDLEHNKEAYGVDGFGVAITTMEEVFLKVGEVADAEEDKEKYNNGVNNSTLVDLSNKPEVQFNTGWPLWGQRLLGLIMKRVHYYRRKWYLIILQVLLPVMFTVLVLALNNSIDSMAAMEPARVMDITQYGTNTAVVSPKDTPKLKAFHEAFPASIAIKNVHNASNYLIKVGEEEFQSYRDDHIVAAVFRESTINVTAMYNGIYLHSLPLSVNLVHKTLLNFHTQSSDWNIIVENAPLPNDPADTKALDMILNAIKSIMIAIFLPIGLSAIAAYFVKFPIEERVSNSKHLQMMTGVSGFSYWSTSFLWDFMIFVVSACLMLIAFSSLDTTNVFTGNERAGIVFLLLLLYSWSATPFSYMFSFLCKRPETGVRILFCINFFVGMIMGLTIFIFQNTGESVLNDVAKYLQWVFYAFPSYAITVAFMNLPMIAQMNSRCDFTPEQITMFCNVSAPQPLFAPCCPGCTENCFEKMSYFNWDSPGLLKSTVFMMIDGFVYFILLCLIELGVLYSVWYNIKGLVTKLKRRNRPQQSSSVNVTLDSDVVAEEVRVRGLFKEAAPSNDALLVDNMSKEFWGFKAVENLCFGVKNGECFGLLGINGAGKTTTFRMLTGDEVMTSGNAYLHYISLKQDRNQFLQKIGYCPQFDALNDCLTGRETLWLFARLRGIKGSQIRDVVEEYLSSFDLLEHADKITSAYSGGNKRKLSSAMAFFGNPSMVFLDEPTTGVDPVARRKIWDILLAAKDTGTSIILTSHSMEECEVLCSRLAIMVNGHFKCLGGIQHLKSKYGQGFTVIAKLKAGTSPSQQSLLQSYMEENFPGSILKDVHQGLVQYHITDTETSWNKLFSAMEEAKMTFNLEDYSVSQTSLEQVFLSFAREQKAGVVTSIV